MVYDDWNPALFTQRDAICAAENFTYKISVSPEMGLSCQVKQRAFKREYLVSEKKQLSFAKALYTCFLKNIE